MKPFPKKLLLAAFILPINFHPASAAGLNYTCEIDGIYYLIHDGANSARVTNNGMENTYSGDIVIPDEITFEGKIYDVDEIVPGAFAGCTQLTSVTLPASLKYLPSSYFHDCSNLTEINFQCSEYIEYIGNTVFNGSAWHENQPDGILYLGDICLGYKGEKPAGRLQIKEGTRFIAANAFRDCTELTAVEFPNSVVYIGDVAFNGCTALSEISIPDNVLEIGYDCFINTKWHNDQPDGILYIDNACIGVKGEISTAEPLQLKEGTRIIADRAFYKTGITGPLNLPDGLLAIGRMAFNHLKGLTGELKIPNTVNRINVGAFDGCSGLTGDLRIPDSMHEIERFSLSNCGFSSLIIPWSSVSKISNSAFSGCKNITGIRIENGVTKIGSNAFDGCTALTSLSLLYTYTLRQIGMEAFAGCDNLQTITMWLDRPPVAYEDAFSSVEVFENATLSVPKGSLEAYQSAEVWKNFQHIKEMDVSGTNYTCEIDGIYYRIQDSFNSARVTHNGMGNTYSGNIVIPDEITFEGKIYDVKYFDPEAFAGCTQLTSITLPTSLKQLSLPSFYDCSNLTEINFQCSEYIELIDNDAFNGSAWYENQPEGILYLGDICLGFKGEKPAGRLQIKEGTRFIADGAFQDCTELTAVEFPNSVVYIGNAFNGCTALSEISIPDNVLGIRASFNNTKWYNDQPDGILYIDNACIGVKGEISTAEPLQLKEGTRIIADYAFKETGIAGPLNLPDGLLAIGRMAFYRLNGLTGELKIPNTVKRLNVAAFDGCSGLTGELRIPDSIHEIEQSSLWCCGFSSLIIPGSVSHIRHEAFSGCKNITDITIENGVTKIGSKAFSGCTALTSLSLPYSLRQIGMETFAECDNLQNITIFAPKPPIAYEDAFSSVEVFENATLSVPKGSLEAYQSAEVWKNFQHIKEIDVSGMAILEDCSIAVSTKHDCIIVDAPADYLVEVYDINGRTIYKGSKHCIAVEKGFYIVSVAGKTFKVGL